VFDKRVAMAQVNYGDWVGSEIAAAPKDFLGQAGIVVASFTKMV
jgi:hypothetical protein